MLFLILWKTDPKLLPDKIPFFSPPKQLKSVLEYVTPGGLFIEIVEADSVEPVTEYVNKGIAACEKVDVYPVLTVKEWLKISRSDVPLAS